MNVTSGVAPAHGHGQTKYWVCHHTGSASHPWVLINVAGPAALGAHLRHGDEVFIRQTANGPVEVEQEINGKIVINEVSPGSASATASGSTGMTCGGTAGATSSGQATGGTGTGHQTACATTADLDDHAHVVVHSSAHATVTPPKADHDQGHDHDHSHGKHGC